jgi:hypothetical protein
MNAKRKSWVVGLALAGTGVALARLVSQQFDEPGIKLATYITGTILAFAGLGIIMYSISKRPKS